MRIPVPIGSAAGSRNRNESELQEANGRGSGNNGGLCGAGPRLTMTTRRPFDRSNRRRHAQARIDNRFAAKNSRDSAAPMRSIT